MCVYVYTYACGCVYVCMCVDDYFRWFGNCFVLCVWLFLLLTLLLFHLNVKHAYRAIFFGGKECGSTGNRLEPRAGVRPRNVVNN